MSVVDEVLIHQQEGRSYVKMLRRDQKIVLEALSDGFPDEEDSVYNGSFSVEEFEQSIVNFKATGRGSIEQNGSETFLICNLEKPSICFRGLNWSYVFSLTEDEAARILA